MSAMNKHWSNADLIWSATDKHWSKADLIWSAMDRHWFKADLIWSAMDRHWFKADLIWCRHNPNFWCRSETKSAHSLLNSRPPKKRFPFYTLDTCDHSLELPAKIQ